MKVLYTDHNGIFRGDNLLQKYTLDQLSAMIANGTFDDIYIGDYIEKEMTSSLGGTEKVRWLVAGINHYLHCGSTEVTSNHIVLIPEDGFKTTAKMNPTNTTESGFVGSMMYTDTLPEYNNAITITFGSSHVLTYNALLTNAISKTNPSMAGNGYTGVSNNWSWYNVKLLLPCEVEVYGTAPCSSSFYDIGTGKAQFPIFALAPELIQSGRGINKSTESCSYYWLRSVVSSAYFAGVVSYGYAGANYASLSRAVRPFFLFK